MAFRFGDPGGRSYGIVGAANANVLALWTYIDISSSVLSVVSSGGRCGGSCLRISGTTGYLNLNKTVEPLTTLGGALAFKFVTVSNIPLIQFRESNTGQCDVRIIDGMLYVTRAATIIAAVPGVVIQSGVWYHLEFKATIHPTAGAVYVGVNGIERLNLTNVNTRNTANTYATTFTVGFVSGTLTGNLDIDDIIFYDGNPVDCKGNPDITGLIGDCRLDWLLPNGPGTSTQFTPDSGSNYTRVNEIPADTTSYVETSTPGYTDTYVMGDLSASATTVKSLLVAHYARKTDIGLKALKAVVRSAGIDAINNKDVIIGDNYAYYFSSFGRDPNNNSWTPAVVNALESGQQISL